jgi:radical SAM superfamily enzyme
LFSDVLPSNHKMPKDMYQLEKLLSALGMEYEKTDVCKNNYIIFYKEHKNEKKCLKCGKPRFVEVVNEDGEMVWLKSNTRVDCVVATHLSLLTMWSKSIICRTHVTS